MPLLVLADEDRRLDARRRTAGRLARDGGQGRHVVPGRVTEADADADDRDHSTADGAEVLTSYPYDFEL